MYCQRAGFDAGSPKATRHNLNFQLPPKSDKVDDENASIFVSKTEQGANLNLNNVSADVVALFAKAPRVRVSIEIIED